MCAAALIVLVAAAPSPAFASAGDTYLSFVAEGASTSEVVGFSELSMNFSTSTPDPGEEVPETYC